MQKLFQIYDSKSETWVYPTPHPARGQAIRSFSDGVNDHRTPNNVLAAHPADFTLFEVGEYDDRTGIVSMYESRISVVNGLDVKVVEEQQKPQRESN